MKKLLLFTIISISVGFMQDVHAMRVFTKNNAFIQYSKNLWSNKFVKAFIVKKCTQLGLLAGVYSFPFINPKNKNSSWLACHQQGKKSVHYVEQAIISFFAAAGAQAKQGNYAFLGK